MQNFKNVMSKRTDEELVKILFIDRDLYQPEALDITFLWKQYFKKQSENF